MMRRRGFTAVELVFVIVLFAVLVAIVLEVADGRRRLRLRQESTDILVVVRSAFSMYGQHLPPLSGVPGHLAPAERSLPSVVGASLGYGSRSVTIPEAHRRSDLWTNMTDGRFWDLGYALPDEETGLAFADAYKDAVRDTGKPSLGKTELGLPLLKWTPGPLPISGPGSISFLPDKGGTDGYEAFVQGQGGSVPLSSIPVLIERPGFQDAGSNVLYLDGTVRFMPYPGEWPMTEKFIKALESLDELKETE